MEKKSFREKVRDMVTKIARHLQRSFAGEEERQEAPQSQARLAKVDPDGQKGEARAKAPIEAREVPPKENYPAGGVAVNQKVAIPPQNSPAAEKQKFPRGLLEAGWGIRIKHDVWCMDQFLKKKGMDWPADVIEVSGSTGMVDLETVSRYMTKHLNSSRQGQKLLEEFREWKSEQYKELDAAFSQSIRVMFQNESDLNMASFETFKSPFLTPAQARYISEHRDGLPPQREGDRQISFTQSMCRFRWKDISGDEYLSCDLRRCKAGIFDFLRQEKPATCVLVGSVDQIGEEHAEANMAWSAQKAYPGIDMRRMLESDEEFQTHERQKTKGRLNEDLPSINGIPYIRQAREFVDHLCDGLIDLMDRKGVSMGSGRHGRGTYGSLSVTREDTGSDIFTREEAYRLNSIADRDYLEKAGCDDRIVAALIEARELQAHSELIERYGLPKGPDGRIDAAKVAEISDRLNRAWDNDEKFTPEMKRLMTGCDTYREHMEAGKDGMFQRGYASARVRLGMSYDNSADTTNPFTIFSELEYSIPHKLKEALPADADFEKPRRMVVYSGEPPRSLPEFKEKFLDAMQRTFPAINVREDLKGVIRDINEEHAKEAEEAKEANKRDIRQKRRMRM